MTKAHITSHHVFVHSFQHSIVNTQSPVASPTLWYVGAALSREIVMNRMLLMSLI